MLSRAAQVQLPVLSAVPTTTEPTPRCLPELRHHLGPQRAIPLFTELSLKLPSPLWTEQTHQEASGRLSPSFVLRMPETSDFKRFH